MYTLADQESRRNRTGPFRFLRILLRILIVLTGLVLLFAWYLYRKEYSGDFAARKSVLSNVVEEDAGTDSGLRRSWLTLEARSGLLVECGMLVPQGGTRFPAIIVLGGKATGKHAIDYAFDVSDAVIVAMDYRYEVRPSYSFFQFLSDVPQIRAALIDMVPSVMLLTDYLLTRHDVDSSRIILLGYSFGAPLVPVIATHDKRIAAAVMVYGGGDLTSLIRHNVRRYEGPVISEVAADLGGLLLRPLEPMRYAADISPVPLLMINGTEDEQIPKTNAELFYEAARDPKKLIWIRSRHVRPGDRELNRTIIGLLKHELRTMGIGTFR